jgi:hypothetical protein
MPPAIASVSYSPNAKKLIPKKPDKTVAMRSASPPEVASESGGGHIRRKDLHFLILVKKPEIDCDFRMCPVP